MTGAGQDTTIEDDIIEAIAMALAAACDEATLEDDDLGDPDQRCDLNEHVPEAEKVLEYLKVAGFTIHRFSPQ